MLDGVGQPIDVHEIDAPAMHRAIQKVADFAKENCPAATPS
jgi:hypothetical protein